MDPNPASSERSYLPQLDAVRAIACLLVLAAHLKSVRGLGWVPSGLGVVGVGLFFVLSGFLITRVLLTDKVEGRGLNGFYNRRAARVLPIYYLTLLVLAFCRPGRELVWAATFSFNFLYLTETQEYFNVDAGGSPSPPIAHTWSLCVEEHFYWVWPLVVVLLPTRIVRRIPAVCAATTPIITYFVISHLEARNFQPAEVEGFISRMTPTQLTALSLGCLAAFYEVPLMGTVRLLGRDLRLLPVIGAAALLLAAFLWALLWQVLSIPLLRECFVASLLHLACGGLFALGLACSSLGGLSWLNAVGRISYGLYLYHLPVYAALGLATVHAGVEPWRGGVAVALTFLAATASFRFIERPIQAWVRQRGDRFTIRSGPLAISAGSAAMLLSAWACSRHVDEWWSVNPERPHTARFQALDDGRSYVRLGVRHDVDAEGFRRSSPFPAKQPGVPRICVVGDSYSFGECVNEEQIVSAVLGRLLKERGIRTESLNVAKTGAQIEDVLEIVQGKCRSLEPDVVIYAATFTDYLGKNVSPAEHSSQEFRESPEYSARFRRTLREIRDDCRKNKCRLLAIFFAQYPNDPETHRMAEFTEAIFRDEKVDFVPIELYLKKNSNRMFANGCDAHPDAECHRIYADMLADKLQPIIAADAQGR